MPENPETRAMLYPDRSMPSSTQPVIKRWIFFGFSICMLVLTGMRVWGSPFDETALSKTPLTKMPLKEGPQKGLL